MSPAISQSPVALLSFPGDSWRQGLGPSGEARALGTVEHTVRRALSSACLSGPAEDRLAKEQRGGDSPEASR